MKLHHYLAFIPYIMMIGGVLVFNRVEPYVFGLPFLLFWIVLWVILTSVIMAIIYKIDPLNKEAAEE